MSRSRRALGWSVPVLVMAAVVLWQGPSRIGLGATQYTWINTTAGTHLWSQSSNWDANGVPVDGTPADNNNVKIKANGTYTIDLNDAAVNLPNSDVNDWAGGTLTVDDLGPNAGKVGMTFDRMRLGHGNYVFNVPVTADYMDIDLNANNSVTFNEPITVNTIDKGQPGTQGRGILNITINAAPTGPITLFRHKNWITNFNAPGTITTLDLITGHSTNTFNANGALTIGTLNMTLTPGRPDPQTFNFNNPGITVGTLNWQYGHWKASADGGVAVLGATPSIPVGASLVVAAPQTTLPTMLTVPSGTALIGDMTNFVYSGAGQNVTFGNGAVFIEQVAPAGGPLQASDLPPGVQVYRGILTATENATTDPPGTAYRGMAFGNFYTTGGELHGTYTSGGGDLNIRIDGPVAAHYSNGPYFIGDGVSTTANFEMGPTGTFNIRRAFNHTGASSDTQIADPNQILTFNVTRDPGNERLSIFTSNQQGRVFANQTINVSNGSIELAGVMNMGIEGAVTLTDGVWNMNTTFTGLDTGTFTLAGRTTLELANGDSVKYNALEALGTRFSYSGQPMAIFSDRNGGPWIYTFDLNRTSGATPVLAEFLANVDYGSNHYHPVDIGGDGLYIGDGKFLADAGTTNSTSRYEGHDGAKILPGQPSAITMGFAAIIRPNLAIAMDVDAPDATIQVGTTDPNRLLKTDPGGTGFVPAGIPTNRVTFEQNVNVKGVKIESGTGQFNQDLTVDTLSIRTDATLSMAGGKTATVSGLLSGGGTFGGGNGVVLLPTAAVAPGDSVGRISGDLLDLQASATDQATYRWEVSDPTLDPWLGAGTGWDLIDVETLTLASWTLEVVNAGLNRPIVASDEFPIAMADDPIGGSPLAVTLSLPAGWTGGHVELRNDDRELWLSGLQSGATAIIPEPGAVAVWALLALCLAGMSAWRQRR